MLLLPYEALVADPGAEMRRVCAFLGEVFEPSMVKPKQEAEAPEPKTSVDSDWAAWRREHHAKSRAAVTASSLEKWRTSLSPFEVAMIEGHCGPVMRSAGYRLTRGRVSRAGGRAAVAALRVSVSLEKKLLWRAASWRRPPRFSLGLGIEPVDVAFENMRGANR